jgi:hypothetical protein
VPAPAKFWLTRILKQTAELRELRKQTSPFTCKGRNCYQVGAKEGESAFLCGNGCDKVALAMCWV